jgi:hypothetical protein
LDAETWYVGQEIVDNGFAMSLDEFDSEAPTMRAMKTIAAKSIAEGRAPKALFEKRDKAVKDSVDPHPRLTAAKIALLEINNLLS